MPPHNVYTSAFSPAEAISVVMSDRDVELDLTVSKNFWGFEGDWETVPGAYRVFFENMVESMSALLGPPVCRARSDGSDRKEWDSILPEYADAQDLAVWEKDGIHLYLRYSWEDKEAPILIALGTEGCADNGLAYPG
jgi:hypothetical protein